MTDTMRNDTMDQPRIVHIISNDAKGFNDQMNALLYNGYVREGEVRHVVARDEIHFAQTLILPEQDCQSTESNVESTE